MSPSESPFQISIAQAEIDLLKKKLELFRFPDELENLDDEWSYGVPLSDMKRLVARWQNGWDWRKHEADVNKNVPMFTRDIEVDGYGTLNIHYVHQRSNNPNAIPLLFSHGWPGSFLEGRKITPLLTSPTDPTAPSFHFVTFSLPGFGFSEAPRKKGFNTVQFAEVGHKLMQALGYTEYVAQGGDWGHAVVSNIAQNYGGKHAKAYHSNFPMGRQPDAEKEPELYAQSQEELKTPEVQQGFKRFGWFKETGTGYSVEQSTQPQTLGYSLADSPVGLLAWIYEKLHHWTDEYPWDDDEVLDWVSLYWFSRAGPAASLRIYFEHRVAGGWEAGGEGYDPLPYGTSYFPKELASVPISWVKNRRNLVFSARHDKGGHFAAHERPDDLVDDLRRMFGKGGPAFEVVPKLNGY